MITAIDIGPIKKLKLETPEGGGIVVVRGRNGSGKSVLLEAAQNLLAGKGGAPVRDGARTGELEAFGAIMKIGGRTSHLGELEVVSIEGRLKPADIVDPGLADPEAADRKRIQALVQVAATELDLAPFHKLLGGQESFEKLCPGAVDKANGDILALAGAVKRCLDAEARKNESAAQEQARHAAALKESIGTIDVKAECDADVLQARLQEMMTEQAKLEGLANAAVQGKVDAEQAREKIAEAEAKRTALSVTEARARMKNAEQRVKDNARAVETAEKAVESAKAKLATVKEALGKEEGGCKLAQSEYAAALERDDLIDGWKRSLEAAESLTAPEASEVESARQAVKDATQAMANGQLVRQAKANEQKRQRHVADAKEHAGLAEKYRNMAGGIDGVLSGIVGTLGTDLRIEKGRLVCATKRGESTLFAELSHGERWKRVIDLVVDVGGENSVIVLPQDAFEGLDGQARQAIAQHARDRKCTVLTAECSDDEQLTSVVL